MTDKYILDKLEINAEDVIDNSIEVRTPEAKTETEATLSAKPSSSSALLQIDITKKKELDNQITAALKLINTEFKSVTILLDTPLANLIYGIVMPYMSGKQIQEIVKQKKLEWTQRNIHTLNKLTIPWTISTNEAKAIQQAKSANICKAKELIKNNDELRESIKKDRTYLRSYLTKTHNITDAQYQKTSTKNDKAVESYLIENIAIVAALHSIDKHRHNYLVLDDMNIQSYFLPNLPQRLTLQLTTYYKRLAKTPNDLTLLKKVSHRNSYLEHSVKHFSGNVYLLSSNHTYLACNKQQSIAFGMSDDTYIKGKNTESLFPKDDASNIANTISEIVNTSATKTLVEDYPYLGSRLPYLSIKIPLRNKNNKNVGIIGFSKKIDDQEETVKLTESKPDNIMQKIIANDKGHYDITTLKTTIEHMPGCVFWQDTNGKILGCNHAQALFAGYKSNEGLIGKTPDIFLTKGYAKEAKKELAEIISTGKPLIKEEVYKAKDDLRIVISHKTPVKDDTDNVVGIVVISVDISKSKQRELSLEKEKEKLEAANNFKSQFIQDIEHDMRTPFVGLCNMTELYAHKETDSEKRKQLQEISSCAQDLLAYCDSLLEFSKSSSFIKNDSVIHTKRLIESIAGSNSTIAKTKDIDFIFEYDESIPKKIVSDPYRIKRILNTLIGNSIKQTQKGYIKLIVKLVSYEGSEAIVSVSILDSSPGINKEQQEHIFKKCGIISSGNKPEQGLSLNEVKRFVEDLRGQIAIESEINKGTNITVTLPLASASAQKKKPFISKKTINQNILIVEDSRITVKFLSGIMQEIGCYSQSAPSEEETLSILKREHFDILLLDIGLEDTDGYTLARKIRALEERLQRPPVKIIMMTAQQSRLDSEINKELGVVAQFTKPLKVDKLMSTILDITQNTENKEQQWIGA